MELIIHRINKINNLKKIPFHYGVEIDIRSYKSNLILNHEPYKNGDKLSDYLEEYKHGTIVLNIKQTGIEDDVLNLIKKYKIKSYFLLDVEMPYFYNSIMNRKKNLAVRYSEYEDIKNAKNFINKVNWVWIDTVTKLPIDNSIIKVLKKFKSCLVCPERWGRENDIKKYYFKMKKLNFLPTAVMTSLISSNIWYKLINQE